MHGKLAMGMLCYNRPIHTALTLAYAFVNKSEYTDLYAFHGIEKGEQTPSQPLTDLLNAMVPYGLNIRYRKHRYPANTGGSVDTLMQTLDSMEGYACYFKIDDDVLIGAGTDIVMADLLLALEEDNVYMLMGQVVSEHIREARPFCWDVKLNGYRVVERVNRACPMETYTAVSYKMLAHLREHGMSDRCDNVRGVYGYYVRKLGSIKARTGLVLTPAIQMQHIGLTATIDPGDPKRCWAPARKWQPRREVIEMPYFDYSAWEAACANFTARQFALETIGKLRAGSDDRHKDALTTILDVLFSADVDEKTALTPGCAYARGGKTKPGWINRPGVRQPKRPEVKRGPLRRDKNGNAVRAKQPVKRVSIRQPR